jgi:hypothetical protein
LYAEVVPKYFPKSYKLDDEALSIFRDAVKPSYISDCQSLDNVDYTQLYGVTIGEAREKIGIETDLLQAYYRIEKKRFPESFVTKRLLS